MSGSKIYYDIFYDIIFFTLMENALTIRDIPISFYDIFYDIF